MSEPADGIFPDPAIGAPSAPADGVFSDLAVGLTFDPADGAIADPAGGDMPESIFGLAVDLLLAEFATTDAGLSDGLTVGVIAGITAG